MSYVDRLLSQGERRIFVTRHHWFLLIGSGWGYILLLLAGIALEVYGNLRYQDLQTQLKATDQQMAIGLLVIAFIFIVYPVAALAILYLRRRFDQVIVTNFRVLHAQGILSKKVLDSSLEKVNDVVLTQSFVGRLFDFGSVEILTASDSGINMLKWISQPVAFKRAMLEAKQELEGVSVGGAGRASVPELIAQLGELRDRGTISEEEFQAQKTQLLKRL